ncbi:MAG: hypothetical protein ACRD01_06040 [Terriglobales bacterium]
MSVSPPAAAAASNPAFTAPPAQSQALKLHHACQQFEGILLDTMWSELQNDPLASDASSSDAGGGSMQSLGMQAMSSAMASQGGLGLGAMLEKSLSPQLDSPNLSPAAKAAWKLLKSQPALSDNGFEARRLSSTTDGTAIPRVVR